MLYFPMTLFVGGEPMVINDEEELTLIFDNALSLFQKAYEFRLFGGNGIELSLKLQIGESRYVKENGLRESTESTLSA